MTKPKFWELVPPDDVNLADFSEQPRFEILKCSEPGHREYPGKRLSPLSLKIKARALCDFTWTCFHNVLINDRVLDVLQAHKATGFEVRPAEMRPKGHRQPVPRLHELIVTGWAGWVSPEAGLRLDYSCPKCPLRSYRVEHSDRLINPATWDSSDFFVVWPIPKIKFVSERIANILRHEGVTGVELRPAEQVMAWMELGPGSLAWHMPEARARELGEPLGIYW